MQQKHFIPCSKHPHNALDQFLNISPNHDGIRFACAECYQDFLENGAHLSDYSAFSKIIQDPMELFKKKNRNKGTYDQFFEKYIPLLDFDIEQVLNDTRDNINRLIENIRSAMKNNIEVYKLLKEQIVKTKEQFAEIIGHSKLKEEYHTIVEQRHSQESQEWKQLNQTIDELIKSINAQDNDDFSVQYYQLESYVEKMSRVEDCSNLTSLQDDVKEIIGKMTRVLNQSVTPDNELIQTELCKGQFLQTIINKIHSKTKISRATLIYKASRDGKSYEAFWQRVKGKSGILLFIKLDNKQVIGGYTPVKWLNNSQWQEDESISSFIFQVKKQEIYELKEAQKSYAMFGWKPDDEYIFQFGSRGQDFHVTKQFTINSSNLNQGHYYTAQNINDPQTHLLGQKQAAILDIELYHLEQ